jgi:hypothetical protein
MKKITNKILITFLSIVMIVNIVIVVTFVHKYNNFVEEQTAITTTTIKSE